jgi:hypothetical protein
VSLLNPIEEAQESHQEFTNEDLVEMVATTGEEKEKVDDNQDGKVVATTTMAEKLKPLSLIVVRPREGTAPKSSIALLYTSQPGPTHINDFGSSIG